MSAASVRFACDTLAAAAPLVFQLQSVALEWSLLRKGKQLTPAQAREALCDFPGSPCALFQQPRRMLSLLGARAPQHSEPLHVVTIGTSATQDALVRWLVRHGWRATIVLEEAARLTVPALQHELRVTISRAPPSAQLMPVDALLLQRAPSRPGWLTAPLAELSPAVALVSVDEALPRGAWLDEAVRGWLRTHGFGSAFVPNAAAEAAASSQPPGRRRKGRAALEAAAAAAPHKLLVLWRAPASGCALPVWDLRRPLRGGVPAAEAEAVRGALARGYSHSEWFGCAVLEPLQHLARTLFVAPRRKGKSVWGGCFRPNSSACYWFSGSHRDGEHFVEQVLSSPDVLLARLSAHRAAAAPGSPPPLLLDPAAGEANYSQHLPDGMGALPAARLVREHGWHARLAEPVPPTFAWLERNLAAAPAGAVRLRRVGVTAAGAARRVQLWAVEARVPELEPSPGLPAVTRQRLQYLSSTDRAVPEKAMRDLWQINHLAGGPIQEALGAAGRAAEARAFGECKEASATRKQPCYELRLAAHAATLLPWRALLEELGAAAGVDLLVLDVWDGSVAELLRAFPFDVLKPALLYYRNPYGRREAKEMRTLLLARGYSTSAHWETSAWGELNLAWRSDRCLHPGMPGAPPWAASSAASGGD